MKNGIKPVAESVLIPLGLPAAASAANAGIHKKILGSGTAALIISNEEMEEIMKIVKSLEDSGLFLKGVSETIRNEAKEQKEKFLSILLGTLGVRLLGNMLAGRGIYIEGDGMIRAGYGSKNKFNSASSFNYFLKYKKIIKMSLDLMEFILEIIYLTE